VSTSNYRKQETQLPHRNSTSAAYVYLGWLSEVIVQCTQHRRIADLQLDYSLVISTVSAKKASEIRGR